MHRLAPLALLLLPITAYADVAPPGGGGGCRCDSLSDPSLAWIPVALTVALLVARRRTR